MDSTTLAHEEREKHLEQLGRDILKRADIVPFIGAGFSANFGMPTWPRFLEAAVKRFETEELTFAAGKARKFLLNNELEAAAEALATGESETELLSQVIAETFGDRALPPTMPQEAMALTSLVKLPNTLIVTTNYDSCIEHMCVHEKIAHVQTTLVNSTEALKKIHLPDLTIIKLHGDAVDRENQILTKSQYDNAYGNLSGSLGEVGQPGKAIPRILSAFCLTKILLFVGCSLKTDRTMLVLKQLETTFPGLDLYAIIPTPSDDDSLSFSDYRRNLVGAGIKPIWYTGLNHAYEVSEILNDLYRHKDYFAPVVKLDDYRGTDLITYTNTRAAVERSVFRVGCRSDSYQYFATVFSQEPTATHVIWAMDGSPLDKERYGGDPTAVEARQDNSFLKINATHKQRLVIFRDVGELSKYRRVASVKEGGSIVERRKYHFENSLIGNLRFSTRQSLFKNRPNPYHDFGFIRYNGKDQDEVIFCSSFNTMDFASATQRPVKEFVVWRGLADGYYLPKDDDFKEGQNSFVNQALGDIRNHLKELLDNSPDSTQDGAFDKLEELWEFEINRLAERASKCEQGLADPEILNVLVELKLGETEHEEFAKKVHAFIEQQDY